MKLFPALDYTIELTEDASVALNRLIQNTKSTNSLVSEMTDKAFIGQVHENRFKVISSEKGYGSFCVISGDLLGNKGSINLRVHQTFKILSTVLMVLPILAIVLTLLQRKVENPIELAFPASLGIMFVRLVIVEVNFRIISKKGLNRLTEIIRISAIKKNMA